MRQIWFITGGAIFVFSLIVGGFTLNQANQEEIELSSRMQSRAQLLAASLAESIGPPFRSFATTTVDLRINNFVTNERLVGLAVFDNTGSPVALSDNLPQEAIMRANIGRVMDSNEPEGIFVPLGGEYLYVYTIPLRGATEEARVIGALTVIQNATYINEGIRQVWLNNALWLILQLLVFVGAVVLLVRFAVAKPLSRMTESLKSWRTGAAPPADISHGLLWAPLTNEIRKITTSLQQARSAASEEARMRLEKVDSPWTAERLKEFVRVYLKDRPIYVVSNREPYIHFKSGRGKIEYSVPAHGMVTAVESVMVACGGLWLAHGSGDADKETVDKDDKIAVPPEEPRYTLRRIWLTDREVEGHYTGFSNEALFPLCHMSYTRPVFRKEDWTTYKRVNGKFAEALLAEIKHVHQPIILVQDLHFALLPRLIKKARPDAQVGIFWHHPWPSAEQFSICPWRKEILDGILGADVVGFHTQQYCNNFLDTVGKEIESLIDFERFTVTRSGHESLVRTFPISIAFTNGTHAVASDQHKEALRKLGITTEFVGLGVDRLDYIKGVLERLRGVEWFLDRHPEYRERFTFLQISAPTRLGSAKHREYGEEVSSEVERINKKFQANGWKPIVFEKRHYSHAELDPLYRSVHFCLVSSLHDGMNLVSKEFAAARDDETGVLILSQFTGSSRDLKGAIIINPYSLEEISSAIHTALTMPKAEQHRRMRLMRNSIKNYNVYRWAAEFLKAVASLG